MIPNVKTWVVTLVDGKRFEVLAPTRRLALLNWRFEDGGALRFAEIRSIGLKREKH